LVCIEKSKKADGNAFHIGEKPINMD